ncbi:2OG-Fe dioxygenase family protein [Derxia lacustris]|uniref:2OG-Fe dioxygenase family protein n=1 Tax=Derxia lacustris TaxID=764842 RepID=UPI000A17204E|nr:2OG-Fe dioxygenase family protein [Derxia lacustris]
MSGPAPSDLLAAQGFAVLDPAALAAVADQPPAAIDALRPSWAALPPDDYLRDGGAYRFRRHASLVQDVAAGTLAAVPHRAHWQPTSYNALHGGIERWFAPVADETAALPAWHALIAGLGRLFARAAGVERWFIEAHQFRIDTARGIGRPTPEGAHRDGVDYVAVVLVERSGVRGGETRVFDAAGPHGIRFTMTEPWSALLLDDARVIHETTPLQSGDGLGFRDTLVLTFRRGGFQDAVSAP